MEDPNLVIGVLLDGLTPNGGQSTVQVLVRYIYVYVYRIHNLSLPYLHLVVLGHLQAQWFHDCYKVMYVFLKSHWPPLILWHPIEGIILCMHPANERWSYIMMTSLHGLVHTQNKISQNIVILWVLIPTCFNFFILYVDWDWYANEAIAGYRARLALSR